MSKSTEIQAVHANQHATGEPSPRIVWTGTSDDLHVNLIALGPGEEIGLHINQQLDVLLTCIDGAGALTIGDEEIPLGSGSVVLIPKGARRGTRAGDEGVRYVTCHRRRGGLMPAVQSRS
jgi:mannose-6-phosphate isomerase-like protein (cupin superfamily)